MFRYVPGKLFIHNGMSVILNRQVIPCEHSRMPDEEYLASAGVPCNDMMMYLMFEAPLLILEPEHLSEQYDYEG